MIASKVTKRNQTTIPRQICDALKIQPGQILIYEIENGSVILRSHKGAMASFGALKPKLRISGKFKTERASAREDWSKHSGGEGTVP